MASHIFHELFIHLNWHTRGFGVVSFGKKQLGWVLEYVANQKEHHRCGNVMKRLEMNVGLADL